MRIATYNVENLFSRATAMNSDDPAKTTAVLNDVAEFQQLIEQPVYSDADKKRMLEILRKHRATGSSGPFFLQETRRRLYASGKIVADGRAGLDRLDRVAARFDPRSGDQKYRTNYQ